VTRSDGGGERNRTDDLLLAKQALSHLSYTPDVGPAHSVSSSGRRRDPMVGLGRLELPTSRLSGVRSNQLSYRPIKASHDTLIVSGTNWDGRDREPDGPQTKVGNSRVHDEPALQLWSLLGRDTTAAARPRYSWVELRAENFRSEDLGSSTSLKGGDPAAGSPTATLLRLHPSR
jgi:hypothetical protein